MTAGCEFGLEETGTASVLSVTLHSGVRFAADWTRIPQLFVHLLFKLGDPNSSFLRYSFYVNLYESSKQLVPIIESWGMTSHKSSSLNIILPPIDGVS